MNINIDIIQPEFDVRPKFTTPTPWYTIDNFKKFKFE